MAMLQQQCMCTVLPVDSLGENILTANSDNHHFPTACAADISQLVSLSCVFEGCLLIASLNIAIFDPSVSEEVDHYLYTPAILP